MHKNKPDWTKLITPEMAEVVAHIRQWNEEHPATIPQMIEYLAQHDIPAERKSLYDDIEALRQCGLDVEYRKAQGGGYYVASREFQLPELKLLVDAVQSSKFLSLRKSNALITKLEKLASRYEAQALRRQVYVTHRVKNMNESIYYNVDALHSAIAAGSRITFRYFDWDITGKKKYRHEGKRYQISPWALLWDDENYYLVGYDAEHGERRHYRVDKMEAIAQTGEERLGKELFSHFDPAEYSRKVFGMYGGEPQQITLQFAANMANIVFDRFGRDRILTPTPAGFTITVEVVPSPQFFAWLTGLGTSVQVLSPQPVARQFQAHLRSVLALYG